MSSPTTTRQVGDADTSDNAWPCAVIVLHWLTAFALLVVFGLAIAREWVELPSWDHALLSSHRLAGLVLFALVAARLACRAATRRPAPLATGIAFVAARVVHALLYLLLLGGPVLGYLLTCARLGHVEVLGLQLACPIARDRALAETLESLHHLGGWLMLGLIAVHTAAALWHHLAVRDQVLLRMLPRQGRLLSSTTAESP